MSINHTGGSVVEAPSGGYGPREQGRYAMDLYTTVETAYIAP